MLLWKRHIPKTLRSLIAVGALSAFVALAAAKPYTMVHGQEPAPPKEPAEEPQPAPVKESDEKVPVKEPEEKAEKEPVKGEEKEPVKGEGKEPVKGEGKEPMKEEGDVPKKGEGKVPEGRPVPRKGDPEVSKDRVPGRGRPVPGREMKEPGEGKRPVPGKEVPKGGPIVGFNGGISFDAKHTSKCGKGQICYNYALPTNAAGKGTLVITLSIYQNNSPTSLVFTPPTLMQSGVLKDGDHYCFDVDPTTFPGIDLNAGGFDFVASAKFSLGGNDTTVLVGSVPQGVVLNKNNDYRIECEPPTGTKGEIVYDARTSTKCGKGQICFNVKRPTMKDEKGNIITATGELIVTLYQDGQSVLSLPGMAILSDIESYCIPIDPANIKGLNCDLGGFDFVATATFTFGLAGVAPTSATVGTRPNGIFPDRNNDYKCECEPGTGTDGKIVYDGRTSTTCGKGQICFNLKLPTMKDEKGNIITATGVIDVTLFQNGVAVLSLPTSPVLNDKTGARYCFPIDPANMKKLNCELGGFDFVATATFDFGEVSTASSKGICGIAPNGIIEGVNNDYQCECEGGPEEKVSCCLENKENVIYHEDFEHPVEFPSDYHQVTETALTVPGTYSVSSVDNFKKACEKWIVPEACFKTKDIYGSALLVNGLTNQKAPSALTHVIWAHKFNLPSIVNVKEKQYRVCFRYLPLPQCCFDIPARPYVVVEGAIGPLVLDSDNNSDTGCGRLYAATFTAVPGSTINLQILLDGNKIGDGNDVAIDNISVATLVKVPFSVVDFNMSTVGTSPKDVTLTAPGLMAPYTWVWTMYDPTTMMTNSYTTSGNTITFPGLVSTTDDYVFRLEAKSPCHDLSTSHQDWSFGRAKAGKTIEDPNPEPVGFEAIKAGKNKKGLQLPAKRVE